MTSQECIPTRTVICSKTDCHNMVLIYQSKPDKYGRVYDKTEFHITTASGYRNHYKIPDYLCSAECLEYFRNHNMCYRCSEGHHSSIYKEKLGHSLCTGRSDHNASCIDKYNLEKRFIKDYRNSNTIFIGMIVFDESYMPDEFDELQSINRYAQRYILCIQSLVY